jgi:hypothetical protein
MLTDKLVMELQRTTPLSRLNLAEGRAVIARLIELGYTLTPPAPASK